MHLRAVALVVALLGGLCWGARWGAELAGGDPGWGPAAHWAGLALLGVALAVVGAGLVSRSATWLRLIVAVAFPLLVWSVYAVVKGDGEGIALDGVLGVVSVVLAVVGLVSGRSRDDQPPSRHGAHSVR